LAVNPNHPTVNAAAAVADPDSAFHHHRRLIALRREHPVLVHGAYSDLDPDHSTVFAYTRSLDGVTALVLLHMGDTGIIELEPEIHSFLSVLAGGAVARDVPLEVKGLELTTNHDVKAVEYWLKAKLEALGASKKVLAHIHFACTSEDINNLAYALMQRDIREKIVIPTFDEFIVGALTTTENPIDYINKYYRYFKEYRPNYITLITDLIQKYNGYPNNLNDLDFTASICICRNLLQIHPNYSKGWENIDNLDDMIKDLSYGGCLNNIRNIRNKFYGHLSSYLIKFEDYEKSLKIFDLIIDNLPNLDASFKQQIKQNIKSIIDITSLTSKELKDF
jgi:hypothetical protein